MSAHILERECRGERRRYSVCCEGERGEGRREGEREGEEERDNDVSEDEEGQRKKSTQIGSDRKDPM